MGDRRLRGGGMTGPALPATLDEFLHQRLPLFIAEPPPKDWVEHAAHIYGTNITAVEQAIRSRWRAVPVAPAVTEQKVVARKIARSAATLGLARARDTLDPFDRVIAELRTRGSRISSNRDPHGGESVRWPELVLLQELVDERAGILEFDAGYSRTDAERLAQLMEPQIADTIEDGGRGQDADDG
jgi:hypothetical protein